MGANCFCDVGYYLKDGACVACSSSTYKDFVGDGACSQCPTYARVPLSELAVSRESCVCPTNSRLDAVNGRCNCVPGYFWDGLFCLACPLSSYKGSFGDGPCLSCPPGSHVALGPGTALANCSCTNNGKVATANACVCDLGWGASADGLSCSQCSSFQHKDTLSDSPCLPCPALASVLVPPGKSLGSCMCLVNSLLVVTATGSQCQCLPGHGYDSSIPVSPALYAERCSGRAIWAISRA